MFGCFFCTRLNDVRDEDYGIPLCITCRHMDHFQILLIQQLCLIGVYLYDLRAAASGADDTYSLAPEEDDDAG